MLQVHQYFQENNAAVCHWQQSYFFKYKATCFGNALQCTVPSQNLQISPHQEHDLLVVFQKKKERHTNPFLSIPAELKSKAIKLFPPSLLPGSYQLELIPLCATCKLQKLLWEVCFY